MSLGIPAANVESSAPKVSLALNSCLLLAEHRGPEDHINMRVLQTMISGIFFILGLRTRMSDPYVYVVFWAPNVEWLTKF